MTDRHILMLARIGIVASSAVILVSFVLMVLDVLNQLGI